MAGSTDAVLQLTFDRYALVGRESVGLYLGHLKSRTC